MTDKDAICQISIVNEEKVASIREEMLDEDLFSSLSDTFKAFGDRTRVRILYALSRDELCVCDLSSVLDMSVSAISHQLRVLRNMNLVKYRKDGKMAYYSLCDDHVVDLIGLALIHVRERK
jgi:ArsR family transcriptional regulator, lead/cadmium/zinc/bismuth-responsive transcriptional repressor